MLKSLAEAGTELTEWATQSHPRVSTGFEHIDAMTSGGAAEGEVILFLAYSGVGKTSIACHFLLANPGLPAVFFSLEMHARFLLKRMAAMHSGISDRVIEDMLRAGAHVPEIDRLAEAFPQLYVADEPGMSLKAMSATLDQFTEEQGVQPKLVVIDYLELVGGVASLDGLGQVDKVSRKVKDFARQHDVVVFVLHQLNKGGSAHEPVRVSDARFGGNVAADYVLAAYKPSMDPALPPDGYRMFERDLCIQFLKTRGGPAIHPSGVKYDYDPESMRIQPLGLRWAPPKVDRPADPGIDQREMW
jgi:replicative DNA helicase